MNHKTIEKALKNAVNNAPIIPFAEIAALPYVKMSEHDYITSQKQVKAPAKMRQFALAAVCCLLVMVSLSGWYRMNRISDSVITLDVNPSVEIITNYRDKVIAVRALNDDADVIIGSEDFKDTKLVNTVQILLGSLVENKYLDVDKNTILLTVKNKNTKKADELLAEIDTVIRVSLASQNINPTIMKQIILKENDRSNLAKEYRISEGKMELIQYMISLNNKFTLDMLSKMSVEQLLKLAEENSMDLSDYLSAEDQETEADENSEKTSEEDAEYEEENETDATEDNELEDEDNEGASDEDNEGVSDEDNEGASDEENEEQDFRSDDSEASEDGSDEQKDREDSDEDDRGDDKATAEDDASSVTSHGEGDEGDTKDDAKVQENQQSDSEDEIQKSEDEQEDQTEKRDSDQDEVSYGDNTKDGQVEEESDSDSTIGGASITVNNDNSDEKLSDEEADDNSGDEAEED